MRTTLDVADDVLDAARVLAAARGVAVGLALSELARRGIAARMPVGERSGFPVFQVTPGAPQFGLDEVEAAANREDQEFAREFLAHGR